MAHVPLSLVDHSWKSKTTLRVLVLVFSAPVVALGVVLYVKTQFMPAIYFVIPSAVAIIWSLINFLRQCAAHRPVHPGWNVFFDLLLWLTLGAAGGYFAYYGSRDAAYLLWIQQSASNPAAEDFAEILNMHFGDGHPDNAHALERKVDYTFVPNMQGGKSQFRTPSDPNYNCPYFDSCMNQNGTAQIMKQGLTLWYAAAAMFLIAAILEFILFIISCVSTAHYNRNQALARQTARYEPSRHMDVEAIKREQVNININNGASPLLDEQNGRRTSPRLSAPAGYSPYREGGPAGDLGDGGRRGRSISHSSLEPYEGVDSAYKGSDYGHGGYGKGRSTSQGSISNAPLVVPSDRV